MVLKDAYLSGAAVPKNDFRQLLLQGEKLLWETAPAARASGFTRTILPLLDTGALRAARIAKAKQFVTRVQERFATLPSRLPDSAMPFNPVLVLPDRERRDELRRYLIASGIYAPVHWQQDHDGRNSGDLESIALSGRLLTVPLDFRCSAEDVAFVAETLMAFRD